MGEGPLGRLFRMTSVGRGRTCLVWSNIITDCIRVDASSRDHDGGERVRERGGPDEDTAWYPRYDKFDGEKSQNPGKSGVGTGENRISGSETHQHGSIRVGGDDCGDGGWVVPPPPVGEGRTVHHRPPGHHGRGWGAKWHPKRRWRWVCGSGVRGSGDTEGKHVVGGGGGGELSIPASRGSADPRRIEWQRGGREDGWVRDPRAVETER
jgi:hypothetical protein